MSWRIIRNPPYAEWSELCIRPGIEQESLSQVIRDVFEKVEKEGDEALRFYSEKFDRVKVEDFKISKEELKQKSLEATESLKKAIDIASANIKTFHQSQVMSSDRIETTSGVECWQESRPIDSVGLYIPGGTAPLFSTVLMLAIPAQIAGCSRVVLCSPPSKNGIHPAIAYAALKSGVTEVYQVGGAQAIAALSIGTPSIEKVMKIFGPGNQYVTAAKQFALSKGTAIDMPAGPSELLVIATEDSDPAFIAADLLSQAEHGIDSQVVCLSDKLDVLENVISEVENQLASLPRKGIAQQALEHSRFILLRDQSEMINFSNAYGPEHLIINCKNYEEYIPRITNAGSVFLGNYCPESAGDYASGTNHTLPTSGYSKMYSGVNLDAYVKKITFQHISDEGIHNLGPTIETLAIAEGLDAHARAVSIRLDKLKNKSK